MNYMYRTFLLLALLTCSAPIAFSCSCADPSQREKFREANTVLLGEVTEIRESKETDKNFSTYPFLVRFKVERQWKGAKKQEFVALADYDNPGMCGDLDLKVGERFLIYAYREKGRLLIVTDCGPNRRAEYAEEEIEKLDSFWFRMFARLYPFPKV
jgi:hypothetical protein